MLDKPLTDRGKVAAADELQPPRRHQRIVAAAQAVPPFERQVPGLSQPKQKWKWNARAHPCTSSRLFRQLFGRWLGQEETGNVADRVNKKCNRSRRDRKPLRHSAA